MLALVGLEFEGQPHSGLDDAKNIARVLLRLIADRAFVRVNEKIIIKVKKTNTEREPKLCCLPRLMSD